MPLIRGGGGILQKKNPVCIKNYMTFKKSEIPNCVKEDGTNEILYFLAIQVNMCG